MDHQNTSFGPLRNCISCRHIAIHWDNTEKLCQSLRDTAIQRNTDSHWGTLQITKEHCQSLGDTADHCRSLTEEHRQSLGDTAEH